MRREEIIDAIKCNLKKEEYSWEVFLTIMECIDKANKGSAPLSKQIRTASVETSENPSSAPSGIKFPKEFELLESPRIIQNSRSEWISIINHFRNENAKDPNFINDEYKVTSYIAKNYSINKALFSILGKERINKVLIECIKENL